MVLFYLYMTKIFTIFLVTIMIGKTFNIHFNDFIKISELVEHAEFHAKEYGDDFSDFLSKHYGDLKQKHQKQHEQEEHHHLPFDHHDCKTNTLASVYLIKKELLITSNKLYVNKVMNFSYNDLFSNFEKQEIFQPPQVA